MEPQQRVELCLAHYERAVLPLAEALVPPVRVELTLPEGSCFTDTLGNRPVVVGLAEVTGLEPVVAGLEAAGLPLTETSMVDHQGVEP